MLALILTLLALAFAAWMIWYANSSGWIGPPPPPRPPPRTAGRRRRRARPAVRTIGRGASPPAPSARRTRVPRDQTRRGPAAIRSTPPRRDPNAICVVTGCVVGRCDHCNS